MDDFEIIDNIEDYTQSFTNNIAIQNKEKVKHGDNLTSKQSMLLSNQAEKSVCEIIKDNGYGSGFFGLIKIDGNDICCLFSNNHVISENMLANNEKISLKLNNEIYNISLKLKRRIWNDKNIDFICIEIIEKDNLLSKIEPFEIDENNYNIEFELENYDKRGIVIASIGRKGEIELPQGEIYYAKNNNDLFLHNCNTEAGFSGGAIILRNNLKVIGIHCGYDKNNHKKIGIYFKEIFEIIEKKTIKCLIGIKLKEIREDILLFNQNKNNKEEIEDNFKVYLNNKIIKINNKENEYIMNKNNFEKDGEYELKIIFKNKITNLNSIFSDCNELISIDLSNFDISKVTDMKLMFNKCSKLKEIKGINKFNTSNTINMSGIFQECYELEYLDLSNFNTSKVADMFGMFNKCNKLKEIKGINKFNTNNVTNMRIMFQACNELVHLDISNFHTSKVTNMEGMFNKCGKLKEIKGINKFNTSNVTDMRIMFQACNELEFLDISNFDTSKVINMEGMFNKCNKLRKIRGINKFNTSNVINMNSMFQLCNELEYLYIYNFDTTKVINMGFLFNECKNLIEIKGIDKFNTSNVINMNAMFQECNKLEYLDLSNFDTSKVNDMGYMFYGCTNLKYLNLENFTINNNCNIEMMFRFISDKCILNTKDTKLINYYKSCIIY